MQMRIPQMGPLANSVCVPWNARPDVLKTDAKAAMDGRQLERRFQKFTLDKGMKDDQKVTFHNEGHQKPRLEPGNFITVLDQKGHAVFIDKEMTFLCVRTYSWWKHCVPFKS